MRLFARIASGLTALCLCAAMCTGLAQIAFADDQAQCQQNGIVFNLYSDGTASVAEQVKADGTCSISGVVVIPDAVQSDGRSYSVTEIANNAFSANGSAAHITSISIPSTVRRIGMNAFKNCADLETVQFAEGSQLGVISSRAFGECTKLKSMTIPYSVYKVASFAFEECSSLEYFRFEATPSDKTELKLSLDEGVLSNAGRKPSKLAELILPSRLLNTPMNMCEYQNGLKKVVCEGSLSQIGYQSFQYCESLEYFEFPVLTNETTPVAGMAFRGCLALKTLVFRGDEHYGLSNSSFGGVWGGVGSEMDKNFVAPDVQTVIYYGSHTSNLFAKATHYNNVNFYASADAARAALEEGADAAQGLIGSARIRKDVLYGQISSTMPTSDESGQLIYDDGGFVPELSADCSWYFPGHQLTDAVVNAATAGSTSNSDLNQGYLFIDGGLDEFAFREAPIDFSFQLMDAAGNLVSADSYEAYLTDEKGAKVGFDDFKSIGAYQLHVKAADSESYYTGEATKDLSIVPCASVWTRYSGETKYATPNHVDELAFTVDDVERLVIVKEGSSILGSAACGMAGAMDAPVIYSPETELSSEAVRYLRFYKPSSVYLVGFGASSASVKNSVLNSADSTVTVTSVFDGSTDAETVANLYLKTTPLEIWDESKTAVVISPFNQAAASAVATVAYATKSPVFLMAKDGTFSSEVTEALAGFERVIIVGAASFQLESDWIKSLKNEPVVLGSDSTEAFEASLLVADYAVEQGIMKWKNVGVTSSADASWHFSNAFVAAASLGKRKAPLLFVGNTSEQEEKLMAFLTEKRYLITEGFLVCNRRYISDELHERIQDLWPIDDEFDMRNSTISVSGSDYAYETLAEDLIVTAKSATGTDLIRGEWGVRSGFWYKLDPEDANFVLYFYDVDTDISYSLKTLPGGNQYSMAVTGEGDYHGTKCCLINVAAPVPVYENITSIKLSATSFTYDGKVKKPSVSVMAGENKLSADDYSVTYSAGCKNVGTYAVTVTGKGTYQGTKTASFTIRPQATRLTKLAKGKKSVKATWKKVAAQCSGYQIAYSTSSAKSSSGTLKKSKSVTVKGCKVTSRTVSKLKSHKRYYFQVRTYKTVGKKTYYSSWSKILSVKTK